MRLVDCRLRPGGGSAAASVKAARAWLQPGGGPTEAQADLSAERRIENVRAAFTPGRDYRRIIGRTVLLVDDVTTTGATLHECATALRAGGAADVWAVTAARAVTRWR
jgi:hypothetical protein